MVLYCWHIYSYSCLFSGLVFYFFFINQVLIWLVLYIFNSISVLYVDENGVPAEILRKVALNTITIIPLTTNLRAVPHVRHVCPTVTRCTRYNIKRNISAISWLSVLLMEETGVPGSCGWYYLINHHFSYLI
jgi:hypothetical protein